MKRPIAELRTVTLLAGTDAGWLRDEHETWQILRRKPGYVVHRLYQTGPDDRQRLVYSEWDSKKALDGARHFLQGTPLARRARAALAASPELLTVELVGPVTSTKGIDLPEHACAATVLARLPVASPTASDRLAQLGKSLASQTGHITNVLFRGYDNPALLGALSHWQDDVTLHAALVALNGLDLGELQPHLVHVQYVPLRPSR
jgi:heme-degrading monooxygenase HmoA